MIGQTLAKIVSWILDSTHYYNLLLAFIFQCFIICSFGLAGSAGIAISDQNHCHWVRQSVQSVIYFSGTVPSYLLLCWFLLKFLLIFVSESIIHFLAAQKECCLQTLCLEVTKYQQGWVILTANLMKSSFFRESICIYEVLNMETNYMYF